MKNQIIIILLIAGISFFSSCSKEEGEGGRATISGKIITQEYNSDFSITKDKYYAAEEDVYIVYGDGDTYSDKTETNYDGSFSFKYLRPGTYSIFVYSDDDTGLEESGKTTLWKTVEITETKEEVIVEDIIIAKATKDLNGTSKVYGSLFVKDYNSLGILVAEYYAQDEDVFLMISDADYYISNVKTHHDGSFVFENLPKGNYKIYAYSKDHTDTIESGYYPVFKEFSVTENFQEITLGDIVVFD